MKRQSCGRKIKEPDKSREVSVPNVIDGTALRAPHSQTRRRKNLKGNKNQKNKSKILEYKKSNDDAENGKSSSVLLIDRTFSADPA